MKKVLFLLVLLGAVIAALYYSVPTKADNQTVPTSTVFLSVMQTPADYCMVQTGIDTGRVNLRACPGTNCGVLSVLFDGQALQVIGAGDWLRVQTADNLTGYINSKYCE